MTDDICLSCKHGGVHYCLDKNENPIPKGSHSFSPPELPDTVNFWTYISCKKNFGLPKAAYINKCPLWQSKGK